MPNSEQIRNRDLRIGPLVRAMAPGSVILVTTCLHVLPVGPNSDWVTFESKTVLDIIFINVKVTQETNKRTIPTSKQRESAIQAEDKTVNFLRDQDEN